MDNTEDIQFNLEPAAAEVEVEVWPPHKECAPGDYMGDGGVKVFAALKVLTDVDQHVHSDRNNEVGGFLVGTRARKWGGGVHIDIWHALPAEHTEASRGHLTFTERSWLRFHEQLEELNQAAGAPQPLEPVGWYHSHPGHTAFLSTYDLYIHKNYFFHEWQVALVVDPTQNEGQGDGGFFRWRGLEEMAWQTPQKVGCYGITLRGVDNRKVKELMKQVPRWAREQSFRPIPRQVEPRGRQVEPRGRRSLRPAWAASVASLAVLLGSVAVAAFVASMVGFYVGESRIHPLQEKVEQITNALNAIRQEEEQERVAHEQTLSQVSEIGKELQTAVVDPINGIVKNGRRAIQAGDRANPMSPPLADQMSEGRP